MGSLFVQTARNVGSTVVGLVGGPEKVGLVRELGAEFAVDYTQADWPEQVMGHLVGREITVVLDGVGGENGQRAFSLLGTGGRLLMFGWSGGAPIQLTTDDLVNRGLSATWAIGPKLMRKLRSLETAALQESVDGRWVPMITSFPLAKAADAHLALENRETTGKVVLIP
jgi:NADPH2:quinone reductase